MQVAVGNYDLGICGLDWVEELTAKYPGSPLIKLRDLGYGQGAVYVVASRSGELADMEAITGRTDLIRLVGEYPNLAESFALKNRLRRFSVFPLWGAAEVYPPESAELALLAGKPGEQAFNHDLVPVSDVLDFNACLIVNKNSWEKMDLSVLLALIDAQLPAKEIPALPPAEIKRGRVTGPPPVQDKDTVWLALPDGHQQKPAVELLAKAGIRVDDYPSSTGNRRPASNLDGVAIKVIRPQDMPAQVATGNFDLAITGRDWLLEHLYQFPSSPVTELLDLKFVRIRIVAVVSNDLKVSDLQELKQLYAESSRPVRVASEYVNIADKCARDNHLGVYKVIPTWGATEAFLPEDADLLIENTETGRTIASHNLKIIDTLFISTGCLVGNSKSISNPAKSDKIKNIIEILRAAVE